MLQHDVRDLGEHAALRAHEPDLPELHAQPAVAALQVVPLRGDLLALGPPQSHLLPVQLELEKLAASGAHLQRGDHALLHVVRPEEFSEDALVAARVLRELGGDLVLHLQLRASATTSDAAPARSGWWTPIGPPRAAPADQRGLRDVDAEFLA